MNAGVLPIAILFFALGLGLSFAAPRAAMTGVAAMAVTALLVSLLPFAHRLLEPVFVGLWLSVIASVCLAYLPHRLTPTLTFAAGVNAGLWAGALAAVSAMRLSMIAVIPLVLSVVVGRKIVSWGQPIAVKVVGSWVIAVATLAIFVSLTPIPGYKQDHMQ